LARVVQRAPLTVDLVRLAAESALRAGGTMRGSARLGRIACRTAARAAVLGGHRFPVPAVDLMRCPLPSQRGTRSCGFR